ncbi:MAG: membrane-bound metallopeptidase [Solidesulfovibrio magneticus str. Maddingley MBC34]|uniref:Membrane-bound metallopeptidase n=1 Tax=Solidesulfovibrio magneticus str. Maddingley MBC34 TaxID=1206767 RepID=K6GQK2_9BACT|nr:MAG: membrane-bound metallopeptidase [Solidesulfovibrio magneticus str. Maddingley MBC34]
MRTAVLVLFCLLALAGPGQAVKPPPVPPKAVSAAQDAAKARLAEARAKVAAQSAEAARLGRELAALETARDAEARRLAALTAALWPLRAESLAGAAQAEDWAEADRRFVWTRSLIEAAGASRLAFEAAAAKAKAGRLARDDAALRLLAGRKEADVAFAAAVAGRLRELEAASSQPSRGDEAALAEALDDAASGETAAGEGEAAGPMVFTPPPGGLAWPSQGRVALPFSPSGRDARQGLVLAVPEGSPVTAAADGRVVFTGTLRGLGRVLILAHDDRCHTVYACLSETAVAVGEAVPRQRLLGRSGYCNQTRAPGVYFELRFREKALNPAEWLAVRR